MQKGITLFMAVYAVLILASGGAYLAAADNPQVAQFAGLGLALLVFALAFVAHRVSGAIGNPFNGLVIGNFKWLFLSWIGALATSAISVGLAIGLGFVSIDPNMSWFLAFTGEQMKQGGQSMNANQMAAMKPWFLFGTLASVIFIAPFLAGLMSLGFYAVYGWLGRRLLVNGLGPAFMFLGAFGLVGTALSALAFNPMFPEPNLAVSIPIAAVYGVALTAICFWLFLISKSAIVPALAFATFNLGIGPAQLYFADPQAHMVPPMGLTDLIILILVAIGLWSIKVPDSRHMEVAAVAFDGTSLTSAEVASLEERRQREGDASDSIGEAATESEPPTAPPPPAG